LLRLSRLRRGRGLSGRNRLALRAELGGDQRYRREDDESQTNHSALPFKFVDRWMDYESGYSPVSSN
jgi:hypothetical protein